MSGRGGDLMNTAARTLSTAEDLGYHLNNDNRYRLRFGNF